MSKLLSAPSAPRTNGHAAGHRRVSHGAALNVGAAVNESVEVVEEADKATAVSRPRQWSGSVECRVAYGADVEKMRSFLAGPENAVSFRGCKRSSNRVQGGGGRKAIAPAVISRLVSNCREF